MLVQLIHGNVIFGELPGWVVGWALLTEYIIGLSFVISGISSNLKPILALIGIKIPTFLANPLGQKGGILDILAIIIVLIIESLVSKNLSKVTLVENILVVLKIFAIILFVAVGATAIHLSNLHPFIPAYQSTANGALGGWQGIYAGVAMIFVSYLGVLPYQKYAASAEPIGIALRAIHHPIIATIV